MKIHNEFVVDAPLATVWPALLDLPRVARCVPGAVLEGSGDGGTHRGRITVKAGPVSTGYGGTLRILESDDDEHRVVIAGEGREATGNGIASATIALWATADGDRTRTQVDTDLSIAGPHAQFGRGVLEAVAGGLIEQFARRLETDLAAPATGTGAEPTGAAVEPLQVGGLVRDLVPPRAAAVAGGAVAALVGAVLLRGRRRDHRGRGFTVTITVGW